MLRESQTLPPSVHQKTLQLSPSTTGVKCHNNPRAFEPDERVCLLLFPQHHPPHPVIVLLGLSCVQSGATAVLPQQPEPAPEREVTVRRPHHQSALYNV